MVKQYGKDPESQAKLLRATYDLYNTEVINGIPLSRIDESFEKYSISSIDRLDNDTMDALRECKSNDFSMDILTSALYNGVIWTLSKSDNFMFSGVHASKMIKEGHNAKKIELYNYDNKGSVLKRIIGNRAADPDNVIYIGDDFRDEPCAEIVGTFVVPPLATDEYRQHMSTIYGQKIRTPGKSKGEVYKALTMD